MNIHLAKTTICLPLSHNSSVVGNTSGQNAEWEFVHVYVCVCVCLCLYVKERQREEILTRGESVGFERLASWQPGVLSLF